VQDLPLADAEFTAIRELLKATAGIHIGAEKRTLVVARLARRVRHHGLAGFPEYCSLLRDRDPDGEELGEMVNCLTTNKTEFFREPHHFDFLRQRLVPEARQRGARKLRIWSAGCSTGQEPYSLAMTLASDPSLSGWDIRILASDIDTHVLETAEAGRYPAAALADVPEPMRREFFVAAGAEREVSSRLRSMVQFRRINLVEEPWPINATFDAIFCRNVTIYFDQPTQDRLYRRFFRQLGPAGYLFAGHSENLFWLRDIFSPNGTTVYRKVADRAVAKETKARAVSIVEGEVHAAREPTEVSTLLGSCVAVCLFDRESGIGGLNHFALAEGHGHERPDRFGGQAMETLIDRLRRLGASVDRLQAKIVGGGNVQAELQGSEVAEQNIAFARRYLAARGIPVAAERVGGEAPLRLSFETHTGRCRVWAVTSTGDGIADSGDLR